MTAVYVAACMAIFSQVFVRLVLTDSRTTLVRVRIAFIGLGCAALLGLHSVLFDGHVPALPDVAMAIAVAVVQVLSGVRLWGTGVPSPYRASTSADSGPPERGGP